MSVVFRPASGRVCEAQRNTPISLELCQQWIDGWPGLEGTSPKPRGFLRFAQSSPGHPIHQGTTDEH